MKFNDFFLIAGNFEVELRLMLANKLFLCKRKCLVFFLRF